MAAIASPSQRCSDAVSRRCEGGVKGGERGERGGGEMYIGIIRRMSGDGDCQRMMYVRVTHRSQMTSAIVVVPPQRAGDSDYCKQPGSMQLAIRTKEREPHYTAAPQQSK